MDKEILNSLQTHRILNFEIDIGTSLYIVQQWGDSNFEIVEYIVTGNDKW